MQSSTLNHYEEQLYSMFKSFDVNNEEALDESAVHELCDALQLEERGAALVDTLFEKSASRVTFARFRSGLLAVLGDEAPGAAPGPAPRPPEPPPATEPEPELDLEPRFVFGSKRYGRRSRPAQPERPASPRAASASRIDKARARPRARRSASAMDPRDADADPDVLALDHHTRIDRERALALCRGLRLDAIDAGVVDRIFEDSPTPHTTVGEFFRRLDSTLARAVSGVGVGVTAERLLEEWERVGVRRPRRLLAELGFGSAPAAALPPAELERALDAELSAYTEPAEARAGLLAAALALARLRGAEARSLLDTVAAERDKLRADVAEANARAALLAGEVDEEHARIEADLKESLRRSEARHAAELSRMRADGDAAVERWAGERARLQAEATRRGEVEARLSADLDAAEQRAQALEERAETAEAALEYARTERARLSERLEATVAEAATAARAEAQAAEAGARLAHATRDVRRLQDRADELAAALEVRRAPAPPASACDNNLSVELGALLASAPAPAESARTVTTATAQTDATEADEERERLQDLVCELEKALEAMRVEYESCEEYWADKQRDERRAHDLELRAADVRLADLLARVQECERSGTGTALPAIPETPALEAQTHALEAECAAARRDSARLQDQLTRAQRRLAALQRRRDAPAPAPAPAPPAECVRCRRLEAGGAAAGARALRAEAAARRLQSRLLAADALVKELYVENCQLARHAP